jgi:hypothetical protein
MAHGFSKEKLKTIESQISDASREQDPTCNGMARHGCVFGWCRPMILKGTGFDLKAISVPFLSFSIHVSVISLPNLHCQPFHGKASNLYTVLVYIRHGVRAGWPSSTSHTAPQEEVKRLLEEFAAYTLANAKAEVRNADSHVVHRRLFSRKLQIQTNSGS